MLLDKPGFHKELKWHWVQAIVNETSNQRPGELKFGVWVELIVKICMGYIWDMVLSSHVSGGEISW